MGDEGSTGGKRRNGLSIFLGIVGAVLGFVAGLAIAPHNRMDPIASGMIALFVVGPMGAALGAWLGASLGGLRRTQPGATEADAAVASVSGTEAGTPPVPPPDETLDPGTIARKVGNWLFVAVVLAGAIGALIYVLRGSDTPVQLNPTGPNPVLQFEVRLPAGAPMPTEKDIWASLHGRPFGQVGITMKPELFRRDGERVVLVGAVELAFRTADRQIQMEVAGQPERIFYLTLPDKAPHTNELGAWEARGDAEIRYRAKWPGRE